MKLGEKPGRQRLAALLQRHHWLMWMLSGVIEATRARFTAGVVGVVLNDRGEVLLVEHVFHPKNPWGLPGGWLDYNEHPAGALERELIEELGVEIQIYCPVLVAKSPKHRSHLDVAYLCRAKNDVRHVSAELLAYQWKDLNEIPRLVPFHDAAVKAAQRHLNRIDLV